MTDFTPPKQPSAPDVRFIRFSNSQEIVATRFVADDGNTTYLSDALVVHKGRDPETGQPQVQFEPFCPWVADSTFTIDKTHVMINEAGNEELVDFYNKATGKQPLVLTPKKPSIII